MKPNYIIIPIALATIAFVLYVNLHQHREPEVQKEGILIDTLSIDTIFTDHTGRTIVQGNAEPMDWDFDTLAFDHYITPDSGSKTLQKIISPQYVIKQHVMDLGNNIFSLNTKVRSEAIGNHDVIWEETVFQTHYEQPELQKYMKVADYTESVGHHDVYWHAPKLTDSIKKAQYRAAEMFLAEYNKTIKPFK